MFILKVFSYIINPKFLFAVILLDLAGILQFINKYIFEDVTYLKFLFVACVLDLITGITKVSINNGIKSISSKGLRDTVVKVIQYGSFLIITHVLTHFQIDGKQINESLLWLNKVAYEFLICVEIKSVYENIVRINPKLNFFDTIVAKVSAFIKAKK
jgi:hypothetical protein